ncbi:MAG: amidohydrolase [Cytophagales bacterium]|nr:MAG: amidohydrolase [Cytophagales bacterium]
MNLREKIKGIAQQIAPQVVAHRRHLHSNPELSFQEYETAQFIANALRAMGLKPQEKVADTGVVVLIEGRNPEKKTVALRADIDALPITEANEVSYRSKNIGVMHACGHDAHTSSLLGTAYILSNLTDAFEGTFKLLFQPAEEKIPGGASLMIKEGVLEAQGTTAAPKSVIGQHVMPQIQVGKIGFREGLYMASADEIYITLKGKGGHAAMPELNQDPVVVMAQIITALQQIISRHNNPRIPSILSFGKVIAQGATNIIPNEVYIEGTFRTYQEEWRYRAHEKIKQMTIGIAEAMGIEATIDIKVGYPFLKNNPELTKRLRQWTADYIGEENLIDLDLWPASEDFAYYSQIADACFYRLGTGNTAKGITSSVHTPTFDIDENALEIGAGLMAWLAIQEIQQG